MWKYFTGFIVGTVSSGIAVDGLNRSIFNDKLNQLNRDNRRLEKDIYDLKISKLKIEESLETVRKNKKACESYLQSKGMTNEKMTEELTKFIEHNKYHLERTMSPFDP